MLDVVNFRELVKGEVQLLRIPLPRTPVNKASGTAGALTGRMREASPAGIMAVGKRGL